MHPVYKKILRSTSEKSSIARFMHTNGRSDFTMTTSPLDKNSPKWRRSYSIWETLRNRERPRKTNKERKDEKKAAEAEARKLSEASRSAGASAPD